MEILACVVKYSSHSLHVATLNKLIKTAQS